MRSGAQCHVSDSNSMLKKDLSQASATKKDRGSDPDPESI